MLRAENIIPNNYNCDILLSFKCLVQMSNRMVKEGICLVLSFTVGMVNSIQSGLNAATSLSHSPQACVRH